MITDTARSCQQCDRLSQLHTGVFDLNRADSQCAGMPPVYCTLNAVHQTVSTHSLFNDVVSGSSTREWGNLNN
jgi:hypothetical protein